MHSYAAAGLERGSVTAPPHKDPRNELCTTVCVCPNSSELVFADTSIYSALKMTRSVKQKVHISSWQGSSDIYAVNILLDTVSSRCAVCNTEVQGKIRCGTDKEKE